MPREKRGDRILISRFYELMLDKPRRYERSSLLVEPTSDKNEAVGKEETILWRLVVIFVVGTRIRYYFDRISETAITEINFLRFKIVRTPCDNR